MPQDIMEIVQQPKTTNKAALLKKKMMLFTWLDTAPEFRRPGLKKQVEALLAVTHPTFIAWTKEYKEQLRLGHRVQAQVMPLDIAEALTERLEAIRKSVPALSQGEDPTTSAKDVVEAATWMVAAQALLRLDRVMKATFDPTVLKDIAKTATDIAAKLDTLAIAKAPKVKAELTKDETRSTFGASLSGILLPGTFPRPTPVPVLPPAQDAVLETEAEELEPAPLPASTPSRTPRA